MSDNMLTIKENRIILFCDSKEKEIQIREKLKALSNEIELLQDAIKVRDKNNGESPG